MKTTPDTSTPASDGSLGSTQPPIPSPTAETGDDTTTVASTATADTSAPVDTGPPPTPPPPCDHLPVTSRVYLTGRDFADTAGGSLDLVDIDGDGCDEVLVSEPGQGWYYVSWSILYSAVYVLQEPWQDGVLEDVAFATFTGIGGSDGWGYPARFLPAAGQLVMGGYDDSAHKVHFHEVPSVAGTTEFADVTGQIDSTTSYGPINSLSAWNDRVTVGTVQAQPGFSDWSGKIWVFEAPVIGNVPVADAVAAYAGNPDDRAEIAVGTGDLDGDGLDDLLVGGYLHLAGSGTVAVLIAPPDGDHVVWDVADATLVGQSASGELGLGLAVGDLDGDGLDDAVAAEIDDGGSAYVFSSPTAGEISVADADWTVSGTVGTQWVGYACTIGDLDGDGAPDLAVGAVDTAAPGRVLIYPAPAHGAYVDTDASTVLTSGVATADGFGGHLAGGDVDGDGLYDLVIGAPGDSTVEYFAGSVTIVFGASLP